MNLAEINMILKIEKEFMLLSIFCLEKEGRRKEEKNSILRNTRGKLITLKKVFPSAFKIPTLPNENLIPDKNDIVQKNFIKTPILHNYIFIFT